MKRRLSWIAIGGLAFWIPVDAVGILLRERTTLWALNLAPLLAISIVGLGSWIQGRKPQWGWMLAGVYIIGPTAMLAPSLFMHHPPYIPGERLFLIAFCLFPPMTLWIAVLNGTIFSVLLVSIALPLLIAVQRE
jgi:hypothetical protein